MEFGQFDTKTQKKIYDDKAKAEKIEAAMESKKDEVLQDYMREGMPMPVKEEKMRQIYWDMRHQFNAELFRDKFSAIQRNKILLELLSVTSRLASNNMAVACYDIQKKSIKKTLELWERQKLEQEERDNLKRLENAYNPDQVATMQKFMQNNAMQLQWQNQNQAQM